MISLILLLQADSDIQSAYNRYEEYQSGRGELFLRQVDLALGLLKRQPYAGRIYGGQHRRILVHGFPFGIFYQASPTRIIVVAVVDLRHDPELIRKKLGLQ